MSGRAEMQRVSDVSPVRISDSSTRSTQVDGGLSAIKGFAFQFDMTLLEIFKRPETQVEFEHVEDIGFDDFYIQVKHRSSNFKPSILKKAVGQLYRTHLAEPQRKLRLRCHFPDKSPGEKLLLDNEQLGALLKSEDVSVEGLERFHSVLEVLFQADFDQQASELLGLIKDRYSLAGDDEIQTHHAMFLHEIRRKILTLPPDKRKLSLDGLDRIVRQGKSALFLSSARERLGHEKYLKLIAARYKFKTSSIPNRQRLFVIDANGANVNIVSDAVGAISRKYWLPRKSPAPYVLLSCIDDIREAKQQMWDDGLKFTDGTTFDGCKFDLKNLLDPPIQGTSVRLIPESEIHAVMNTVEFREIHDFYSSRPYDVDCETNADRHVTSIQTVGDVCKIMS